MFKIIKNYNKTINCFSFFCLNYSTQINLKLRNILFKMPKEPTHINDIKKQRQKIKERSSKYATGTVRIHILGSGAEGAPQSLYVFTDHSKYLFNCGEGCQRLAHEHKMKLSRLEHIFVTQPIWSNIGGLPGLALTIQDTGVSSISLHGPAGLDELFTATQRFVVLKDLEICMKDCNEKTGFEDNVMKVQYVNIKKKFNHEIMEVNSETDNVIKSNSEELENDTTDYYSIERKISQVQKIIPNETKIQDTVLSYICRLRPRPGELQLEKCVELGVPPGPLLGKLKNGESVVLSNGIEVHSSEVCSPDDPGPVFLIVDCPNLDYLDSFISQPEWACHQSTAKNDEDLALVVFHFTPPEVINHPKYQKWIDQFSFSTNHLLLNCDNTCLGSAAVYKIQNKLNLIDNRIFPKLNSSTNFTNEIIQTPKKIKTNNEDVKSDLINKSGAYLKNNHLISCKTLWIYHLRPKKGLDTSNEVQNSLHEDIEEAKTTEGFIEVLDDIKTKISEMRSEESSAKNMPSILFLGTGSCIPNKTRNTSGILIKNRENSYIIFDCGEGTFGQMIRFFGNNTVSILQNIKAIYISHLHADHHIGLVGFLLGRRRLLEKSGLQCEPIYLFAPKQILWWLNIYSQRFESICNEFKLLQNGHFILDQHFHSIETENKILKDLELECINTIFVKHCPNAFGISIKTLDGYKITYSGDTMPCEDLVKLGELSDLLIHEATMEDELEHEAKIKMHSTTSQAIDIGKQMNAKFTLLTHFSQRYARVPRISNNFTNNVGIAFDNMIVNMNDLKILPLLYPAFKILFFEHCEELEIKAAKRQARLIREKSFNNNQQKRKLLVGNT